MKIRLDLKIFIFFALFYLTDQIKIYLTIMFFCVIHELGHIIVGLIFKMRLNKLEIMPCGLTVSFKENVDDLNFKIKQGNLLQLKMILVSVAGPLVSFILALLYTYFDPLYITKQDAIYSNILILLFNLLPIYPLDGGRIINGVLHILIGNKESKIVTNIISNISMIFLTVVSSIFVFYFKNIAIFLICIFLWFITLQENRNFKSNMKMYEIMQKGR